MWFWLDSSSCYDCYCVAIGNHSSEQPRVCDYPFCEPRWICGTSCCPSLLLSSLSPFLFVPSFLLFLSSFPPSLWQDAMYMIPGVHEPPWSALRLLMVPSIVITVELLLLMQYTWTHDRMWRKNRRPTIHPHCFGIDINRNFPTGWILVTWTKAKSSNHWFKWSTRPLTFYYPIKSA